ncbi:B12-binding domain-containing radical SAM protein [Candidatus Amarolinea aalborgensis]|uniref:B12-binding domain-containing radical SAM protein n=1 Tax=Candidatus Amarolinea aalborgensis TaxID=2249329 RepID=UPI003BF9799B
MLDVLLVGAEELENLSTRYLAAVLRQHGFSVAIAPFSTAQETGAVVRQAQHTRPRLIGLSIIFQYRAPEFLALAARLRDALPTAHITTGGHFPTFVAPELLRDYPALDSVVRGEGELTLLELVQSLDTPAAWGAIRGLTFRRDGQICVNPSRPLIADLDSLPFPARDTPPQHHLGIGFSPIVGSRGCYRNCAFCSIHAFYGASAGSRQRFRSVPNLVAEMEALYHNHGVRFFVFNDDEWFPHGAARGPRLDALAAELNHRRLDVIMSIKCRADDVEEELFRRLLDLGVVRAYVGVESGSDSSLRRMNKHTTVAQNRHALEALHRVGMLADFGLIFFDPDSTVEDIRANLDFFHAMAGAGQAPLSFGRMEIYAGTPILARLTAEGRLSGSYLAWNYAIPDPRVEMLFRLMIATLRHRHYDNNGLAKQCSIACYEWTMAQYALGPSANPALDARLRQLVAAANNHSLALLEEMFEFTLQENLYDARRVNDQAVAWASRVNLFDLQMQADLVAWRGDLTRAVLRHSLQVEDPAAFGVSNSFGIFKREAPYGALE